jgi:2-polyprenyl-3-methyl-5-hydroxy-6-metoxy-1,4-benzoquinol methylase
MSVTSSRRGEHFGAEYFRAGAVRRSRALTRSLYESQVLRWLERVRPDMLPGYGARALEIGCGYGYAAEMLAERGYRVTASDISEHAIEHARRDVDRPAVEFHLWDATTPPPFEGGFRLITAFEVVEHLADPEAAIRTWHGLLAPAGTLVLTTPNRLGPASRHWLDPTHVNVRHASHWRRALVASAPWAQIRIGAVQFLPLVWKLDGVMRSMPLPGIGATLRIMAVKF